MSLYKHREKVKKALYTGSWNFAWYLPMKKGGIIDWKDPHVETVALEILEKMSEYHRQRAKDLDKLIAEIEQRDGN